MKQERKLKFEAQKVTRRKKEGKKKEKGERKTKEKRKNEGISEVNIRSKESDLNKK